MRWFLVIIEGAPGWHKPRPGNSYCKAMSLAISKCQVMLQMKKDKDRIRSNAARQAAFWTCLNQQDYWILQFGSADPLYRSGEAYRSIQYHRIWRQICLVFNSSWSNMLKQGVIETIPLFLEWGQFYSLAEWHFK